MRVKTLLMKLLGLCRATVVLDWRIVDDGERDRPRLDVTVRTRASRRRGECGRCGAPGPWYDQGGGTRRWRHLDAGFATCELIGAAPRVSCPDHGPTVAAVPWARHGSAFTRAFEDLVVWDAIASNKHRAAERHGVSWRAVNHACDRVLAEALDRVDLLDGLVAIAIDEVKAKKGQRYLTIVCDHFTGKVIWATEGRSKDAVRKFFDLLDAGETDPARKRSARLNFVTCDGAEWIRLVLAERCPQAEVCMDTYHVIAWATEALDEVRRAEWNDRRQNGTAAEAKSVKGLRWLLVRNWENLSRRQRSVIRDLERSNRRTFRAWQLKEGLREIFGLPLLQAQRALDQWLAWASRSQLAPFVKLARTIRFYRTSIEATIEWRITNGIAESNNSAIGRIRSNARGFHKADAFITMIMLDRGDLRPDLPWAKAS